MTRAIITGVAGFIGSHLSEELLRRGHKVVGIDNFDPWYDPDSKHRNLSQSLDNASFELIKSDIRTFDFSSLLDLTSLNKLDNSPKEDSASNASRRSSILSKRFSMLSELTLLQNNKFSNKINRSFFICLILNGDTQ